MMTEIKDFRQEAKREFFDREAFDRLYEDYHLLLYRSARLMLANPHDAEDVLQETFLAAYLHRKELRDPAKLRSWLFRIMVNKAHRIGAKSSRETAIEDIREWVDRYTGPQSSGVSGLEDLPRRLDIRDALLEMEEKLRTVLVLYYYGEMSVKEIAGICGCFEGTVKSRLHRGRKELRKKLDFSEPEIQRAEEAEKEVKSHA